MPAPQLRYHEFQIGSEHHPASGELEVVAGAEVELVGPRYGGRIEVPGTCAQPVVLHAKPKPATVEFHDAPPRAVVSCIDCPGIDPHANFVVSNLPPMVMRAWATEVTFWVRAEGYEARREAFLLHPGRNDVSLEMVRRRARQGARKGTAI